MTYPQSHNTMPPGPPRSQWSSPAVVIAIVAGVIVLVGGVVGAYFYARGDGSNNAAPPASSQQPSVVTTTSSDETVTITSTPEAPTSQATEPPTAHPSPTVPGADRQGFTSISGARCNADDDAVFIGYTSRSHVVVCQVGSDSSRLYYKGSAEGNEIEIGYPSRSGDQFDAQNKGTVYRVSPSSLTILVPGNDPHVEPMISSWVD